MHVLKRRVQTQESKKQKRKCEHDTCRHTSDESVYSCATMLDTLWRNATAGHAGMHRSGCCCLQPLATANAKEGWPHRMTVWIRSSVPRSMLCPSGNVCMRMGRPAHPILLLLASQQAPPW